jgi:2-keto-4-pentenoate hydratase/2-oxohepta-3-ene-1,7-dioic acid hydratase in catechol pathway
VIRRKSCLKPYHSNAMKFCRITHTSLDQPRYAAIEGTSVFPFPKGDCFDSSQLPALNTAIPIEEVTLLAPVNPSKVVCVGRNYLEHAAELGNKMPDEPLLFLKAPSALIASGDRIELPRASLQVEHEGELGVVIGQRVRQLTSTENPLSYVLGYTCINDVTARDLQRKDVQFTRAKSFDTFCPVGPWIVTDIDPANVEVTTRLNGEIKQRGHTSDMAFSVSYLIRYISWIMTLNRGDLIATGTPAGVSRMKHGDVVEVEVTGIGILRNQVYDPTIGGVS